MVAIKAPSVAEIQITFMRLSPRTVAIFCEAALRQLDGSAALELHFSALKPSGTTMAKTITLNASPTWPDVKNDYVLRYEGHAIGRIRLDGSAWEWQITIPMAMPDWARGTADNLDGSRRAFAAAWGRLLTETDPERLERAWELERAVEARQQRRDSATRDNA
jgi:hypothetical protein